jgi:hypothetical protein
VLTIRASRSLWIHMQHKTAKRRVRVVADIDPDEDTTIDTIQARAPARPSRAAIIRAALSRGLPLVMQGYGIGLDVGGEVRA